MAYRLSLGQDLDWHGAALSATSPGFLDLMSASAVLAQLRAWEQALAARDPAWTAGLRPGLDEAQVHALCEPYGVTPTEDVIALWGWHDGDRPDLAEDWDRPSILPDEGLFLSLAASLEGSREMQRITMDGDDDGDCPWEEELSEREGHDVQMFFRRAYLIFADRESPTYLDCTDPNVVETPTCLYVTEAPDRTLRPSLAARLEMWNRALRAGVWPHAPHDWVADEDAAARAARSGDPVGLEWSG